MYGHYLYQSMDHIPLEAVVLILDFLHLPIYVCKYSQTHMVETDMEK